MNYKVKDHANLVRDSKTNAIINVNTDLYMAAKIKKIKARNQINDIKKMKQEIAEIKTILQQLINTKNT